MNLTRKSREHITRAQRDSACKKGGYCLWKTEGRYEDATVEICLNCGRKGIWNKVNGRIDTQKYLRYHLTDFAQPFGPTHKFFESAYGKGKIKLWEERMKQRLGRKNLYDDAEREGLYALKMMKRSSF